MLGIVVVGLEVVRKDLCMECTSSRRRCPLLLLESLGGRLSLRGERRKRLTWLFVGKLVMMMDGAMDGRDNRVFSSTPGLKAELSRQATHRPRTGQSWDEQYQRLPQGSKHD